jgi:TonB family protein
VVRATVETDGSPTALRIVASSGYDLLNRAALEAVRSATFYPGLIGASEQRRMSVDLRIVFQLVDKESS